MKFKLRKDLGWNVLTKRNADYHCILIATPRCREDFSRRNSSEIKIKDTTERNSL